MLTITSDIGTVILDATLSTNVQEDVDITDHPIEPQPGVALSTVSDNARAKPTVFAVSGAITDTPLSGSFETDTPIADRTRANEALALLRRMKNEGRLCDVSDSREAFSNMVIAGLQVPRDPSTGSAIVVNLTLRQIQFATTQTVARVQRVNKKVKLNKQTAAPADEGKRSLAKRLTDAFKITAPGDGVPK